MPGDADRQHTQLNGVLTGLGMTADTEGTILSDGRDSVRLTDAVEHTRWRLWRGQTRRALCLIQRTLADVNAKAEGKTTPARSAAKLAKALIALETYVSGVADLIIDYA